MRRWRRILFPWFRNQNGCRNQRYSYDTDGIWCLVYRVMLRSVDVVDSSSIQNMGIRSCRREWAAFWKTLSMPIIRKKANWQKKRSESRSWCRLFHRLPFVIRDVPDCVRTMSILKLCSMSWGAGCPVDIRLAPTVAERRTFGCTDHNECLQSYYRKVSCGERDV